MSSQRAGSAGQAHYSCIMGACVSSAASGKPCLFLYEFTKRHLFFPPFFLILTTRVRTKTMSNALSSVERQSCIWKPTNVQISHTPPSRCLTFRFGRKNFFFLICLDEMPRSSFAVRSLESGNYLLLMYYKICNCQSDFIMTPSLKAIFCPRLLSLFFHDFVDINVALSTPQKAVLLCC